MDFGLLIVEADRLGCDVVGLALLSGTAYQMIQRPFR